MNIISHKKISLTFSTLLVVGSIVAVAWFGLPLGIDFTGGSLMEVQYTDSAPTIQQAEEALIPLGLGEVQIQPTSGDGLFLRLKSVDEATHQNIFSALNKLGEAEELRFESIGPVVGSELKEKAIEALIIVLILIVLYIAWAFRKVSRPVSSWKYGLTAIMALFHDVAIPTGVIAVLGQFTRFEIDSFFIAALLTILGYSVHDTIVVFDRIRENLRRYAGTSFEEVANRSVNEVLGRSINTSLTLFVVLLAVFLLGGATTQGLVLVMAIGVLSGTYSSIFVASPLLTLWAGRAK